FLDEFPEFHHNVLEVLRQPLEDGHVTISRAQATLEFPSRFMLIAAMNPCPCGFAGDPKRECRCTSTKIQSYRNRISGPLLDRIDIHIEVPPVGYREISDLERGTPSAVIRARVETCRARQRNRFGKNAKVTCNAAMTAKQVEDFCKLGEEADDLIRIAMTEFHFSARAYTRIIKVARTIADMAGADDIGAEHISEAIQYRSLDRTIWT
ncbi:MAG: ATP-binding protein, partial [Kiritimatiellaeota bacterium]|nr:ATP-binding protein [Kiritimatiellota bacterium]